MKNAFSRVIPTISFSHSFFFIWSNLAAGHHRRGHTQMNAVVDASIVLGTQRNRPTRKQTASVAIPSTIIKTHKNTHRMHDLCNYYFWSEVVVILFRFILHYFKHTRDSFTHYICSCMGRTRYARKIHREENIKSRLPCSIFPRAAPSLCK